jgi:hypothetical protein
MQLTFLSTPRRECLRGKRCGHTEQKEKIEKVIADLKNIQTGGNIYEIEAKTEAL